MNRQPIEALLAQAVRQQQLGALAEAEGTYIEIVKRHPDHAAATFHLCALLVATDRPRMAQKRLEAFLRKNPPSAGLHYMLGKALEAEGALAKCLYHYKRATELEPGNIQPYLDSIRLHAEQGRMIEARRIAATAMARFPHSASLPFQLGVGEMRNHQDEAAERLFAAALALEPGHARALHNLASLADRRAQWDRAVHLFRAARAADRTGELPPVNIGDIELRLGEVGAAIASADAWLATAPADPLVLSNRLLAAHYDPAVTPEGLLTLHRRWDERIGRALRPAVEPWRVRAEPERPLRLGLVSADLHEHPVAYFSIRAVEALDRSEHAVVAYYGGGVDDAMSRRYAKAVAMWRDVAGWSDDRLAAQIVADGIDILFDLSGHIAGGRLPVFARRPAPIQVSWLGYVGTTGLRAMDWLLADRHLIPPGDEANHVERVLRLPDAFACFDPPDLAPEVAALPAGAAAPLRFAAFHNPAKINPGVVALWARVLHAEAGSKIHFIYSGYQFDSAQSRIRRWFADAGIAGDRLGFRGLVSRQELLACYNAADIALDPFPYNGMTTTAEALWMGVPVVTLPGRTFAGRHALSHLATVGIAETIARDADDYVAIVQGLGADRAGLAAMRAGLRARVAASPLCDGARFAAHLAQALRGIWRAWCAQQNETPV